MIRRLNRGDNGQPWFAGVDEVLLFMQSYSAPHDAILRSIELFAKEVAPKPR